jgi:hypothetical protein
MEAAKAVRALHPAGLFARFNFARARLEVATDRWMQGKLQAAPVEKPAELRVYVHELTRYAQCLTTPYGLFLHHCAELQNRVIVTLVTTLLEAGCRVELPLLANFPQVPLQAADAVCRALEGWLHIQSLLYSFGAEQQKRADLAYWCEAFDIPVVSVEGVIVERRTLSLRGLSESLAYVQGIPRPLYPDRYDSEPIWDVTSLLESAATMAELWQSGVSFDAFAEWVRAEAALDPAAHWNGLLRALSAIDTLDLDEFVLSYLTLSETALYAPVLPQHEGLRNRLTDLDELWPSARMEKLLGVASRTRPMQSLEDQPRYVAELCQQLGWISPVEIQEVALSEPAATTDPFTLMYVSAQSWRQRICADGFICVDRWLLDRSARGEAWRTLCDFLVAEYTDQMTHHPDKAFLESMCTRYVDMLGLRAILFQTSLLLDSPYKATVEEKQWMTQCLRDRFRKHFPRGDFDDVQFV